MLNEFGGFTYGYTADQMHAYADAECKPLMNEIAALRQDGSKLAADNTALQNNVVMPLRERVRVLRNAVSEAYGALPIETGADLLREMRAALEATK
jgi:hypothetical protein